VLQLGNSGQQPQQINATRQGRDALHARCARSDSFVWNLRDLCYAGTSGECSTFVLECSVAMRNGRCEHVSARDQSCAVDKIGSRTGGSDTEARYMSAWSFQLFWCCSRKDMDQRHDDVRYTHEPFLGECNCVLSRGRQFSCLVCWS
jgi:hypothetical protein